MVETGLKKDKDKSAVSGAAPTRVVIEAVSPQVDDGKYAAKRVLGDDVNVSASVHADGHNALKCVLLSRRLGQTDWSESRMQLTQPGLDRFEGSFAADELGFYDYTVVAWIDQFGNWKRDTQKKHAAGQPVDVDIEEGAAFIEAAAKKAGSNEADALAQFASNLRKAKSRSALLKDILCDVELDSLMHDYAPRGAICEYGKILPLVVEPVRALCGAWYELFPRSYNGATGKEHGTFKDVAAHLPYVANMGFDVIYLPPIHPIGHSHRKGRNNTLVAKDSDPGSPWAIGAEAGGHRDVHPDLGTIKDFDALVAAAKEHQIDVAIDIAFQCSPDHPYVKEHPEWFYHRADGSIRFAENPPKKYEDIYPINFECEQWQSLWQELTDVVLFWVQHGVHVFRVDNPHTKPYEFWQFLIAEVKKKHPQVIFLSEAFARPKIMYHLAKIGFSQSYTYFTWRNSKYDLMQYFSEIYKSPVEDFFRPNLFANTPDINPEFLQFGGRSAHLLRLVLAATLGASYGIYGPVFELCVADAVAGTEEYKDSEKYEIKKWDLNQKHSLSEFITRINKIRHENPALHQNRNLRFHRIDNDEMIAYSKTSADGQNCIVTVVNLNPHYPQGGTLHLPAQEFGTDQAYQVHDLITGMRFMWNGESNYVRLEPNVSPAFVFKILKKTRTERDFDYFV